MSFSKAVQEEVLVRSARHCCVCHRYTGRNVQVHHITPRAEGGADDIENAIALCFDCHADAGHYNPQHPLGKRFSRPELHQHRDNWWRLVEKHDVEPPATDSMLSVRYLILRDPTLIAAVAAGDASVITPDDTHRCFVAHSPVRRVHRVLGADQPATRSRTGDFNDHESYLNRYPTAQIEQEVHENPDGSGPCSEAISPFIAVRPLEEGDLSAFNLEGSPAELLAAAGFPLDRVGTVRAIAHAPLHGPWEDVHEHASQPAPLAVFLEIENVSTVPLVLQGMTHRIEDIASGLRCLVPTAARYTGAQSTERLDLPGAQLSPQDRVLVPLASALVPVQEDHFGDFDPISAGRREGYFQRQYGLANFSGVAQHALFVGPALWPVSVEYLSEGAHGSAPVHLLDLTKTYSLTQFAEVGSCPHLFWRGSDRSWRYLGEAISAPPGSQHQRVVKLPTGATEIAIVAIEAERTVLEELSAGSVCVRDAVIEPGQQLVVRVHGARQVSIRGWYEAVIEPVPSRVISREYAIAISIDHFVRQSTDFGTVRTI